MDYKTILTDNKEVFDIEDVKYILDCIRNSKNVGRASLKEVLTNDLSTVENPDKKAISRLFDYIVPTTIASKDIKHAIEVYGEDVTPEEFNKRIINEETSNVEDIRKYKNNLLSGIGEIYGLYDARKDGSKVIHLASNELFPHVPEMLEVDEFEHRIDINASAEDYATVVIQLFQSFVNDNLPFYMVVNLPNDLKYGICDPIKIFTSTKNFPNVINEVNRMTSVLGDKLLPPSLMTGNVDGLYGYTSLVNKTRKSPMMMILDVMEKEIISTIQEFNEYHPNELESIEDTWKSRITNLNFIDENYPDVYDQMVDNIMTYVKELNLDLDNVYVLPKITQDLELIEKEEQEANETFKPEDLDENIDMINSLLNKIDDEVVTLDQPVEESKEENNITDKITTPYEDAAPEVMPYTPISDIPSYDTVTEEASKIADPDERAIEDILADSTQDISNDVTTIVQNTIATPESLVETPAPVMPEIEEAPMTQEPVIEQPVVEPLMVPAVQADQPVIEPVTPIMPEVTPQTTDEATEQAFVTGQTELLSQESTPVEEETEEEKALFNTGAYSTVPVEVQSLDGNEIKSVIEEPQPAETLSMADTAQALGEYADVINPEDAYAEIFNDKHEKTTLIEYLKAQQVSTMVPFDSIVTTSDTTQMSGKEFIQQVVVPLFKNNDKNSAYTIETVIDRFVQNISTEKEVKKESFLSRLFKKR